MANSVVGDNGNNFLIGSPGDDVLDGKGGADMLRGINGNDTLIGGTGDDTIDSGVGSDTVVFNRGDGQDTVRTYFNLPGMHDRLVFGDGIAPADIYLQRLGTGLSVEIRGSMDRILVERFFDFPQSNGVPAQQGAIEQIAFADGMQWSRETILTRLALDSMPLTTLGELDDRFYASMNVDAGAGNDTVDGHAAYMAGGAGDDVLTNIGGPNGAALLGGSGNDRIQAGPSDDILDGGSGNDSLDGGAGNNTYLFSRGWGEDRLQVATPQSGEQARHNIVLADVLRGGVALVRSAQGTGDDLLITLRGGGDSLTVAGFFSNRGATTITFADGTLWSSEQIEQASIRSIMPEVVGSSARDTLYGSWESDMLSGGDGDDSLYGMDGHDVLIGGNGNDVLIGGPGDDTLIPGPGFDELIPGDGSNMILFGRDNGQTVMLPGLSVDTLNTVLMAADVRPADVSVSSSSPYLVLLRIAGSDATLQMNLLVQPVPSGPEEWRLMAQLQFADGTRWDSARLIEMSLTRTGDDGNNTLAGYAERNDRIDGKGGDDWIVGRSGDDLLAGGDGNDRLDGDDGNDTLDGGAGDDMLFGGDGNDLLRAGAGGNVMAGGAGEDTYVFALGDGMALLDEMSHNGGQGNVLQFGAGITAADLDFVAAGSEQHIFYGAAGLIRLANYGVGFNRIDFADGTSTTIDALNGHAPVLQTPLNDADVLTGNPFIMEIKPGIFTDADAGAGDVLTYRAERVGGGALPFWLHFDAANAIFVGMPLSTDVGSFEVIVTATDSTARSTTDTFRVTVGAANVAPTVVWSGNVTLREGEAFHQRLPDFKDANPGHVLNTALSSADGSALPTWMGFDVAQYGFWGSAGYDTAGTYGIRVTATYPGGLLAVSTFDVIVSDVNRAPMLAKTLPDAAASAGTAFALAIPAGSFTDPDQGDALALTATLAGGAALPSWLKFDAASATFSGTPGHADSGVLDIAVSATDKGAMAASDVLRLTVADVNVAPSVSAPGNGGSVAEGKAFSVSAPVFQDANPNDVLSIVVTRADGSALPAWMAYSPAKLTINGTAGYNDSGSYALKAVATDKGGLSASSLFSINVANTNRAPVLATPLPAKTLADGVAFSYSVPAGTFADPDAGDTGSYSASALPAWLSFNAQTRTFSGTPAPADAGSSSVIVRYTDACGLAATATLALTITPVPSVTLTGTAGDDILTGKTNNDTLFGLDGNDRLDGGHGADTMAGGNGNDSYVVGHAGDVVTEEAGAGTDSVTTGISYVLPANVENLTLTGAAVINGTGNALNNAIAGNAVANVLDGGAGADTLAGNGGNDTYYADHVGDMITEWAGNGFDQLFSSVTKTLGQNVEVLILTGTQAINGTGNQGNNLIKGNGADNTLNGTLGYDILLGGAGNDRLIDTSKESNLLHAGAGNDNLSGGGASELFIGATGNDNIEVGTGVDVLAFNKGDGQDRVLATGGNDDTLSLGHGIAYADLALEKVGAALVLTMGASDQITFANWYGSGGGSVKTLQVVSAGGADYVPGSASVINDNKVELFDFAGLVGKFDQARVADPSLTSWSMAASLAAFARGGSDTAAIGGDLAYHYALDGDLSAVGTNAGLAIIGSASFANGVQTLLAGSALADGSPLLY
ncbi:putative Ig domain-containing protein [Massilia frigida]|nr:putative Ig domain-containing protein [Massilia frigida]